MVTEISVPENVTFLSEWDSFELPKGILNKELTGCGATSVAIKDRHKTIICCPRINLILNKCSQNSNVLAVYGETGDMKILGYLKETKIPKIMVTYDSFKRLGKFISNKSEWRVVVDEYQYLLIDSGFRSEKTIELVNALKEYDYVTYVSATPIADKYLQDMEIFKDMPYYVLKWENVEKIDVERIQTSYPISKAVSIVDSYQKGVFPTMNGVESKECVIFLNSVSNIGTIIHKTQLPPDQVNIIVADNIENKNFFKEVGENYEIGKIPLKDEPHKMFTFCTSTAFSGCDFYSTCASTFVVSDNKRVHTSIDIATELKQIAGRQRLDSNPFRNKITFIYNIDEGGADYESKKQSLKEKLNKSEEMASFKNNAPDSLKKDLIRESLNLQKLFKYSDNYVIYEEKVASFMINKWAYLNDCFSLDVQHLNYRDDFIVRKQLNETGFKTPKDPQYESYKEQIKYLIKSGNFVERMKDYCEDKKLKESNKFYLPDIFLDKKNPDLKIYYDELGGDRIKALGYKKAALKREIKNRNQTGNIIMKFREIFKPGMKLTTERIKSEMNKVYSELGLEKKGVVSHLEKEYGIKCKPIKISMDDGSRKNGWQFL